MLRGMQDRFKGSRLGKRPRRPKAVWVEEVQRWRQSGQSTVEYAQQHGLHAGTLAGWWSKLQGKKGPRGRASGSPSSGFLPVRVVDERRPAVTVERGGFEVVLLNGRRIVVNGEFGSEALARLLQIAEGGAAC